MSCNAAESIEDAVLRMFPVARVNCNPSLFSIFIIRFANLCHHAAECQQCQQVRDNHQSVEEIRQLPYKINLQVEPTTMNATTRME